MIYYCYIVLCSIFFIYLVTKYKTTKILNKEIIVTAASSSHELSLIQFLYNCFKSDKNIIIVVWDLGFSRMFKKKFSYILKKSNNIIYRKFNYSLYPTYFNINKRKGEYAWKPIIINITYYMMQRTILWLDSGCVITNKLNKVFHDIRKYHCWSIYSCGNISRWTHIGMIKYYNITTNITTRRTCNGALVGFKWNSNISKTILNEWVDCALTKECIAPNGSNRINHRQDQSALSILLYKYNIFSNCPFNIYNIRTHRDLQNITTANIMMKLIVK